jgi:hypothetical protein
VIKLIRQKNDEVSSVSAPVVELTLGGVLPFDRYELELDYIQRLLEEAWSPLTAHVQSKITPAEFEVDVEAMVSRPELEKRVLRELFERDVRFRQNAESWAEGAVDLKQLVLDKSDPKAIVEYLQDLQAELPLTEESV